VIAKRGRLHWRARFIFGIMRFFWLDTRELL
jgi:hypothetical protein